MRVSFDEVFQTNQDGSISPKATVKIGGTTMNPGVSFRPGVSFSGVDLAQYAGKDLEVEQQPDGTIVVESVYN